MAEGFNTEAMLDMYLFENQQLLEKLQETVLEQKDEDCFDEDAMKMPSMKYLERCIPLRVRQAL